MALPPKLKDTNATQLWKTNDLKSNKNGLRSTIYRIKNKEFDYESKTLNEIDTELGGQSLTLFKISGEYTGEWKNNLREGYGVQIYSNGDKYEGEWIQNERSGEGVLWETKIKNNICNDNHDIYTINKTETELSKYKCSNVENLLKLKENINNIHKNNIETNKYNKRYEGEWKNNLKHGKGSYYYKNGNIYKGEWFQGLMHGYGIMYYKNGDEYEGNWKYNKRTGYGRISYNNGSIYEGTWLNNYKEGAGHFKRYNSKKLYVGEWVFNKPFCGYAVDDSNDVNIPKLGLINDDNVLIQQINQIRNERHNIREISNLLITDMFVDYQIPKIKDSFNQIKKNIPSTSDLYEFKYYLVNINDLNDIIKDFDLKQSKSQVWECCLQLGINKMDNSNNIKLTLLDFGKILYLLNN